MNLTVTLIWKYIYGFWVKSIQSFQELIQCFTFPYSVLVIPLLPWWGPQSIRPDSSRYKDSFDKLVV